MKIKLKILKDVGENGFEYSDFTSFNELSETNNNAGCISIHFNESDFIIENEDLIYFFKHILKNIEKIENSEYFVLSLWLSELSELRFYPTQEELIIEEWILKFDKNSFSSQKVINQSITIPKKDFLTQIKYLKNK